MCRMFTFTLFFDRDSLCLSYLLRYTEKYDLRIENRLFIFISHPFYMSLSRSAILWVFMRAYDIKFIYSCRGFIKKNNSQFFIFNQQIVTTRSKYYCCRHRRRRGTHKNRPTTIDFVCLWVCYFILDLQLCMSKPSIKSF